jgi:hypothetical protein
LNPSEKLFVLKFLRYTKVILFLIQTFIENVLKNPEIFYSAFDDKKKEYKKAMP